MNHLLQVNLCLCFLSCSIDTQTLHIQQMLLRPRSRKSSKLKLPMKSVYFILHLNRFWVGGWERERKGEDRRDCGLSRSQASNKCRYRRIIGVIYHYFKKVETKGQGDAFFMHLVPRTVANLSVQSAFFFFFFFWNMLCYVLGLINYEKILQRRKILSEPVFTKARSQAVRLAIGCVSGFNSFLGVSTGGACGSKCYQKTCECW